MQLGDRDLFNGMRGPDVTALQQLLASGGFDPGPIDGIFGARTTQAVIACQVANQLSPDGWVRWPLLQRLGLSTTPNNPAHPNYPSFNPWPVPRPLGSPANLHLQIEVAARRLTLFQASQPSSAFPIAVGKSSDPTPTGQFMVANKVMNPGGALGSRWMGLNNDTYGIHGTNRPALIGQAVSLGCIRMFNEHVEQLYPIVEIGTPVIIV